MRFPDYSVKYFEIKLSKTAQFASFMQLANIRKTHTRRVNDFPSILKYGRKKAPEMA